MLYTKCSELEKNYVMVYNSFWIMKKGRTILYLLSIWFFVAIQCVAQENADTSNVYRPDLLNVYLDCDRCDTEYIRQEITYINYVRDRQDADIHLLITTQTTGSGGTEYTLDFIGQGEFVDLSTILTFASGGTDTDDESRRGFVRVLTMGLVPFLSQTPLADQVSVSVRTQQESNGIVEQDKWNNWVFRIGFNGSANGQRSRSGYEVGSNLSASRVTEEWKITLNAFGDYERDLYETSEGTERFTSRDGTFMGMVARSLGAKWAAGISGSINTSSFENTNLSMELSPALEYNVFPYSESSRRQFRFTYRFNVRSLDYEEVTIFGETAETRVHESLEASLMLTQPWGDAEASFEMSHYIHDFSKNRIALYLELEIQLIRGVSFDIDGRISRINDQLFLAADDPTDAEILLNQRQLSTTYDYRIRLGFSYRFGSIYNNVVNARFGSRRRRF